MSKLSTRSLVIMLLSLSIAACSTNPLDRFKKDKPIEELPAALSALETPTIRYNKTWSTSADDLTGNYANLLEPVWDDTLVYVATEDGEVEAHDLVSGERLWRKKMDYSIVAGLGSDIYQLYLVTVDAKLIAIDKKSGEIEWETQLQSAVLTTPSSNNLVVVIHAVDGKVAGFDPYSGNSYWVHQETTPDLSVRGNSPPQFFENQWVVVGLDNGKVIALRAQQGNLVWEKSINQQVLRAGISVITDIDLPIIYTGSSFLVSTQSGELLSFDKTSGALLWQGNYDESVKNYAVSGDRIIVVTESDKVFVHELETGELVWNSSKLLNRKLGKPGIDDESIYFVDFEGVIHALSLQTGEFVGRIESKLGTTSNAVYIDGDSIFAVDNNGDIVAFEKQLINESSAQRQEREQYKAAKALKAEATRAEIKQVLIKAEKNTKEEKQLAKEEKKRRALGQNSSVEVVEGEMMKVRRLEAEEERAATLETLAKKNDEAQASTGETKNSSVTSDANMISADPDATIHDSLELNRGIHKH